MTGSNIWLLVQNGKQLEGQFTEEQVSVLIGKNPSDKFLVWRSGMEKWADPKSLPEFRASPPPNVAETAELPPAAPPAPAPPPPVHGGGSSQRVAPGDDPLDQMKQKSKAAYAGAARHFQKVKSATDTYSYLPHLKIVDKLLDIAGDTVSAERLDGIDDLSKKAGHFGLLISAVLIFLFMLLVGIKVEHFLEYLGRGLLIIPVAVIAQYVAMRFLDTGRALIDKAPTGLSSKAFLDCFGLVALIGAICALVLGIIAAIQQESFIPFAMGLGTSLVLAYVLGVSLNPAAVNLSIQEDLSKGREAIGILTFLVKVQLRLIPFIFGVVNVVGVLMVGYFIIEAIRADGGSAAFVFLTASPVFVVLLQVAFLPFIAYLLFLLYYLSIEVIRAILVVPEKLDALKGGE